MKTKILFYFLPLCFYFFVFLYPTPPGQGPLIPYTLYPISAQTPTCQLQSSNPRAEGLISSLNLNSSSKFGNPTKTCVLDANKAGFASFQIPSYDTLKSLYFTQPKAAGKTGYNTPSTSLPSSITTDGVYNITQDLSLTSFTYSGVIVVFVDGSLTINSNIINSESSKGIVFVVRNDINIASTVTQVDAFLISADGYIYTAGAGCAQNSQSTQQLVVHGGLISFTPTPPKKIQFCRDIGDNTQPAELIIHQAKYLVVIKKLFSQDLAITTEDTSFAFNLNPSTAPTNLLSVSCSAFPNPVTSGQAVTWTGASAFGSGNYTYTWSGDGFSAPESYSTPSVPKTYTTSVPTTKTVSLTVKDNVSNNTGNATCSVSVNPAPATLVCSGAPNPAQTGQQVAWSATPTGGVGPFSYSWGGNGFSSGTPGNPVYTTYYDSGIGSTTKTVNVTATDAGNNNVTSNASCSILVNPPTFTSSPFSAPAGTSITASWSNVASATTGDWLGLYPAGSGDGIEITFIYTNSCTQTKNSLIVPSGSCSFPLPSTLTPGNYELHYYTNSTYSRIATTPVFQVTSSLASGLVSHWKMDETSGTVVTDSTGNNNGTASGTTIVAGKIGNARGFSGASPDSITFGTIGLPTGNSPYTVALWLNSNGGAVGVIRWGASTAGNAVSITASDTSITHSWSSGAGLDAAFSLKNNAGWHNLVAQWNGTTRSIWVDGVQKSSDTPGTHAGTSDSPLIGLSFNGKSYFNGILDEVGIWNRALTSTEISNLYNGGAGQTF